MFAPLEREIEELRGFLEIERETNRLDRELGRQPPTGSIISEAILGALSDYYSPNSIVHASWSLPAKSTVREAEIETWEMVKESNKKEDYEFFLKHYPNSEYAIPAKLRIQQMKKE